MISSVGSSLKIANGYHSKSALVAFPASQAELETLKVIGTFCGVGLVVSLLLATYGLDISVGFF
jgi:hypothetical protein